MNSNRSVNDQRLYSPHQDVTIEIGRGQRDYCYDKNPDEDFFHQIVKGEIHLVVRGEKYCLNCAIRRGMLTDDRLFWQGTTSDRRL